MPAASSSWKGSAFCIEWGQRLLFITNYHVIQNSSNVKLIHPNASDVDLIVVACAPGHDVALLAAQTQISNIVPIRLGDSNATHPGQEVFCIGYPGVTEALQSSKGSVSSRELSKTGYPYISIDAVANPGNSGGPILDDHQRVIGILSAALHSGFFQKSGIQLFIPINEAISVLQAAIQDEKGIFKSPSLDCNYIVANQSLVNHFQCPSGLYVTRVFENTPIHSHVSDGDVIMSINGLSIDSKGMVKAPFWPSRVNFMHEFHRITDSRVDLKVWSGSARTVQTVTIDLKPSNLEYRTIIPGVDAEYKRFSTFGALIVTTMRKGMIGTPPLNHMHDVSHLVILSVEAECPFEKLEKGQVITHVNGQRVKTLKEYEKIWDAATKRKPQSMMIRTSSDMLYAASIEKCISAKIDVEKRLKLQKN